MNVLQHSLQYVWTCECQIVKNKLYVGSETVAISRFCTSHVTNHDVPVEALDRKKNR